MTTLAGTGALVTTLAGTGALVRLVLRRDRLRLAAWALLAIGVPLLNAATFAALVPTPQDQRAFAVQSAANPVITALLGEVLTPSLAGIVAWRSGVQCVLVAGLASVLLIVRNTRAEEESGRGDLVLSAPVGRHAGLAAALTVVLGGHLAIAVVLAAAMAAGAGFPLAGCLVFAAAVAAGGWVFAGVAAVAAQLARGTGWARSIGIYWVMASFVPTLLGEGGAAALWTSSVGWVRLTRPFAGDRWPVLAAPVALAAVLIALAGALAARRDVGAGVLPDRAGGRGPVTAAAGLRGPLGLAWRLQRADLLGAAAGLGAVSAMVGWSAASFDALFSDIAVMAQWLSTMGATSVGEAFLAAIAFDLRLVVACLAIASALRLRGEELSGHTGAVLAVPISRTRWLGAHLTVTAVVLGVLLVVVGACAGATYALATGRPDVVVDQLATALWFLPAGWFMTAVAVVLYGVGPRWAGAATWGVVVAMVVAVLLWETGAIDAALFRLLPLAYSHPAVASGPAAPVVVGALAAALTAAGAVAFRRRDVVS